MSEQGETETVGKIIISPEVLLTIVRFTTMQEPGVARLAGHARAYNSPPLRGKRSRQDGVAVLVQNGRVSVRVHVIADGRVSARELGENLQDHIANALEEMVGMPVEAVHVVIDDVEPNDRTNRL